MNQAVQQKSLPLYNRADRAEPASKASAIVNGLIATYPLIITIVALLVLISSAAVFLCLREYETVKAQSLNADRTTSDLLALFIRERQKAITGLLQDHAARLSFASALKNRDIGILRKHLADLKKNPEVDIAVVIDHEGLVRARNPLSQTIIGKTWSAQKWYKEAVEKRAPYTSPVIELPAGRQTPAVVTCVPVWNENEEQIGLLAAVQRLDFIARGIEKLQMDFKTYVSVIDASGHLYYSNRSSSAGDIMTQPATAAIPNALKKDTRQIALPYWDELSAQKYPSLTAVGDTGWKVVIERNKGDILQAAKGGMIAIAVMALLLFAFLTVFLIFLRKVFLLRQTRDLLKTEMKLRHSERRSKELFENMSGGAAILEAVDGGGDFIFRSVNQAALASEKISASDVVGRSVCDVFQGVREFGLFDLLHRVWKTGTPEYQAARYFREDRRRGWKQNSVFRLPTGEVVIIFNDISKTKRAEETLKRSEETFAKVFKANPAAMAICRQNDGCILDVNAAFENLAGYRREELIGQTAVSLGLWADTTERDAVMKALSHQSSVNDEEVHLMTRGGKTLITRYSAETVKLATESCLLSIIVDVTAARQAQEETRKLERQLYESQKMEAIGTLAGGIAHDFNNILGAIIGYAEMAAAQPDSKKLRRYADQILAAGLRAKDLVSQILTFSRHHEHHKKPMDLRIITKETLKLLRSTMPANIEISFNIAGIPFTIDGDPTQMHQIIMNICTNAAHAMGEKGGTLDIRLTQEELSLFESAELQLKPGSYVRLTISDTGCGIESAIIDRIFDPFFTTKKIGEGTGLGLSVVYGIVKNHEGHIQVKSTPGAGTTFNIYLPFLNAAQFSITEASGAESLPGGQEHILFVDDEKQLVDLAHRNLSALGYQVTVCSDSREALDIFKSDPDRFDLIITDMTMPYLSGSDLSRRVFDIRPGQPVILCTGYSDFITPEKATQIGIKDFILKPLSRKTLASAVRKALDENNLSIPGRAKHQA